MSSRWRYRAHLLASGLASGLLLTLVVGCQTAPAPRRAGSCPPGVQVAHAPAVATTLTHAQGFQVTHHDTYKRVTVRSPSPGDLPELEYLLVQCETPIPEGYPEAVVVTVPVTRVVALSTTYLPHLERLGQLGALLGVDQFATVTTPAVRQLIDQGRLQQFRPGNQLNLEQLIVAQPELVMTFAAGDSERNSYARLLAAGVPVALVAEYLETSPLGRAEWLKFTALFFNQEATAAAAFAEIEQAYTDLVELAAGQPRPTVFSNAGYQGTWYVPGGQNYAAQLLADAGAAYLWADADTSNSLPLDFEAVVAQATTADYWINQAQEWRSIADALAADPRYGGFQALRPGRAFNNNARMNANGGNDYWESGSTQPHVILADLIHIFHPQLLPDHQLVYYRPLDP